MAPPYGSRLLPVVLDETARSQPDLPLVSVARTANLKDGFRNITFSEIASAVNYLAAWIHQNLGTSSQFDTIAYMGLDDPRYVVVFLAAIKCGYKVLLPSLRNSPWMNASLIEQTRCSHLLYAPEVETWVTSLLEQKLSILTHQLQALDDMIQPETKHYPFDKEYNTVKWDPIMVLHSSGSTGPPKPIVMNHATFAVGDNDRNMPTVPGRKNQNWAMWDFPTKEPYYCPFPTFHIAGVLSCIVLPIFYSNATLVQGPPNRPPTGHLVSEIMDHFKLKSMFVPPLIAEHLSQDPAGLEKCKNLDFLLYGGGPLSERAGNALSKVTTLCQFYGSTETGPIQTLIPKPEDWAYLELHPLVGAELDPVVDDTHEMILKRNPELEGIRALSCNFPDEEVWHTKDLFRPHPTKSNLWIYHGRLDDIIVLSNGEKFYPVPCELLIASHELILGALIIGQGRPQASLILEPKTHDQDPDDLIEALWPTVEKSNTIAPAHAKITRDMIMVSSADRPFDRAPKKTVIRRSTGKKYEKEIELLYSSEFSKNVKKIELAPSPDLNSTLHFVKKVVASAFGHPNIADDADLFVLGLDSLQTTEIISLLKAGIRSRNPDVDVSWIIAKFVYEHPTLIDLARAILSHLDPAFDGAADGSPTLQDREGRMSLMVEKYTRDLPNPKTSIPSHEVGIHVILTGSTGSLGTQILAKLLTNPEITKIYCLDRSPVAKERVTNSLSKWSPPVELDPERVIFYQADFGSTYFGLSSSHLSTLREANLVIHNAWAVDFNHSLASFEAVHIRGVRNLIDFSASSDRRPRILFISSISSVSNWEQDSSAASTIPELMPPSPAVAQAMGYGESKSVAEHILVAAAQQHGIPVSILRVGQIAGPISESNGGKWNAHEWFPLMLKTSKALKKLPNADALGNIDWIPMDILADVIQELATCPSAAQKPLQIFHLVNPTVKPWRELLTVVQARLKVSETCSMAEWVTELDKVDLNDKSELEAKPAVRALDFFRGMQSSNYFEGGGITFSTQEAQKSSRTLKEIGPMKEEWVVKWMSDWGL